MYTLTATHGHGFESTHPSIVRCDSPLDAEVGKEIHQRFHIAQEQDLVWTIPAAGVTQAPVQDHNFDRFDLFVVKRHPELVLRQYLFATVMT